MATAAETLKSVLDRANPNNLADALALVKLGTMLAPTSVTVAQTSATTIPLDPPALAVFGCRVTGGAAAAGARIVSDAGATPSSTVCTLSADGATLTFEAGVTGAVLSYMPRSSADMDAKFAANAP